MARRPINEARLQKLYSAFIESPRVASSDDERSESLFEAFCGTWEPERLPVQAGTAETRRKWEAASKYHLPFGQEPTAADKLFWALTN